LAESSGATGAEVGRAATSATQNAGTVGAIGAAVLLVILFVAYFCGGYVAGRMARFTRSTARNLASVTRRQMIAAAMAAAATTTVMAVGLVLGSSSAASALSEVGQTSKGLASRTATSSTGRLPSAASGSISESLVVIGTTGLSWNDISAQKTPSLWSLLRDGATATLGVRSVHANTCPVDGWLALSAGEQAADKSSATGPADGPDERNDVRPPCRALSTMVSGGTVPRWNEYRAAAEANRFDPSLGLLGDQIASRGGCVQAIGPGAAVAGARSSGLVVRYQAFDASTLPAALSACPLSLVDVGSIRDPADINPRDEERTTTTRSRQVAAVDARVGATLRSAPAGTDVLVASLADAGVTERLRMVAAIGPHFGAGTLESSSTRQAGLVQATDLTPSILEHLGIPRPPSLGGAPLRFLPAGESSEASASSRLRALLDYDEASHEVHSLVEPFFYGWALLQLALYLAAAVLWKRGWGSPAQRSKLLRVTGNVAVIAATVPVSTFLANLLPWWRYSVPWVSVVACVALFAAAISALALLPRWKQQVFGPVIVVCVTTMVVLAADVMGGSRLQLSSLMGEQPVVGGRFYGMGNVTFALFATATLILCLAVGNHLVSVGQPRQATAAVATIGLSAVIVDAAPWWGSDLGGPTALLPAVILLVLAILKIRLTWRRVLAIVGGIGGFLVILGLVELLRPPELRSHLGRFVQTTLDGGASDIIVRKLEQNITLLFGNPLSLLIPVALVLVAYALARPTSWAAAPLRQSFAEIELLRSGLVCILVMWVIGFLLNDSGVAVPAVGGTLALPLVIVTALRTYQDATPAIRADPERTRAARHRR